MYYTTQVQMVIEIKPLLMKHVFAIYDNEDTNFENPEHKEIKELQGYEIVYHDMDKLPQSLGDYRNLTFTIEGKTCSLVNYDATKRNEFYRWTKGCSLPNNIELCRFIDNKLFEDHINFESKDDFQSILNDWFSYERDRQNESMRKLREISTPTPPHQAEVKGFDLCLDDTQLENLHEKLIERKFLEKTTKLQDFKNAFNGEVLAEDFEPLKWKVNYYASIFVTYYIGHKTPWKVAAQVFDNGTIDSLKNAYKPKNGLLSDKQKNAKELLDKIFKSLP